MSMADLETALGIESHAPEAIPRPPVEPQPAASARRHWREAELLLVANGLPAVRSERTEWAEAASGLLENYREKSRLLADHRCPADARIEAFLRDHFADLKMPTPLRLPANALVVDRHGIARELSIPAEGGTFSNSVLSSYRVRNGVLHNPKSDRRTTAGTFHVTEGGLPVPGDKIAVPKGVFAALFRKAIDAPADLLTLPFTANQPAPARSFVSLMIRPTVCPEVPGICLSKSMEVRFFAPGCLVSNLDFVESIFGNAGDPYLPQNDAALDVEHWTGHTGCVILAPHLVNLTKKELGLPHVDQATDRQKRDGTCWKDPAEKYNNGSAFKLTCRTAAGVVVTIIADNYYGYCKKEVKTQISYAANLYGNVEEEHAGGALAFASYSLGEEFVPDGRNTNRRTFADVVRDYGRMMDLKPQGFGVDKKYPQVVYIPEESRASIARQQIWWMLDGKEVSIPLEPGKVYMRPSGFKLRMEKHPGAPSWRLIISSGEGISCHKPCTVSGGGKSEISKSLRDYMLYGPLFVADVKKDLEVVQQVFDYPYATRWKPDASEKPDYSARKSRPILGSERSLGSVIKLLTPSRQYTDAYNEWLESIPNYVYAMVFIIKRFYRDEWAGDWRKHFGVDIVNGLPGNELKLDGRKLVGTYLRVGLLADGSWRTFKVRQDFAAASKVQTQDDISASVVVPTKDLAAQGSPIPAGPATTSPAVKFVTNCESRLFQRPDDAVHRGLDKQTELDFSRNDNFFSNYEPLTADQARELAAKVTEFGKFTEPMQRMLQGAASEQSGYVISSAQPRLVNGKPSANPRYLQIRPDLTNPLSAYVAEQGLRLARAIPADHPVHMPVDAVLIGRRNNPAEPAANIRGLAVYNPIHYQELPELFMDFVCSLTGKSPSTTGAGSEGALTKSPFNALRPVVDLNNAIVSYILTGLGGFSTSAGYVGPNVRVDHDISLLVPEIWCRLTPKERDPKFLIAEGYLEPLQDQTYEGETILASRLGFRITERFVRTFFGRIFDNPAKVFDEAILKPETQDPGQFADGVKNITETQAKVAKTYFEDGSINDACPPLKALLEIMVHGKTAAGKDAHHPEVRALFSKQSLLASQWYQARLRTKQAGDVSLWKRHVANLDRFLTDPANRGTAERFDLSHRREMAAAELERVSSPGYAESLAGSLGTDPSLSA